MDDEEFDRDEFARRYAEDHLDLNIGIQTVYYLPALAPEKEIRLLEVNNLVAKPDCDADKPLDYGVHVGVPGGHRLVVLDVTPAQWERIERREIPLPRDWSLSGAVPFTREAA